MKSAGGRKKKKRDPTSAPFLLDLRLNDVRFFFLLDFSEDCSKKIEERFILITNTYMGTVG